MADEQSNDATEPTRPEVAGASLREVADALRVWQAGDQQGAITRLRPLADAGDIVANVALAQLIWNTDWHEGIPYALRVAEAGVPMPFLVNYVNNMLTEAPHKPNAIKLARLIVAMGNPQLDLLGQATNQAHQGDVNSSTELLKLAALPAPSGSQQVWHDLIASAQSSLETIRAQEVDAGAARQHAAAAIEEHEKAVERDRGRVETLVREVGALVHDVSSQKLAREYAEQAKKEENAAGRYTIAALTVAGLTAVVTLVVAGLLVFGDYDTENVLAKASLVLPFLGFAAYVGKLAGDHRRMAWHWRHVELQIRTADPFIAPLEDAPRKALLAALALRLFPGQPQDPQRGGAEASDPTDFLTELARPPSPPPPSQPP